MEFKDHFSRQAKEYSKYRPKYPDELFRYLASLTEQHNLAWDCATGSGQAATKLADYYEHVIATDASSGQLANAEAHPNVEYLLATAENPGLEAGAFDIVTVATAIHWLDTDKFYAEVKRVLKPGGVIAIWVYADSQISPEVDKIMRHFSNSVLDPHWPAENIRAWDFEESIDFPFERIDAPEFKLELDWSLQDYINYLYTWSSTQNYIKNMGANPLVELYDKLIVEWKDENQKKIVKMPLKMKVGRV